MRIRVLAAASVLFLLPGVVSAQELITGWEGGPSNGYGFAMPVFSIPMGDTNFLVIRPSASYLYYNFREAGGFTTVSSPGASLGLAYRFRTKRMTLTIGPGFEARADHRLHPDGASVNSTQAGARADGDIYFQADSLTSLSMIGSYAQTNHFTWNRAGLIRQITNKDFKRASALQLGAEITGLGNHDVRQFQVGGVFGVALLHAHTSLQFRSGYARLMFSDNSVETRPYFGIGLYKSF